MDVNWMAQAQTRATKALRQIGTVRGNLAFLRQPDYHRRSGILSRFAVQYHITPSAMTRARTLMEATPDDCAAALLANIEKLTADASFIRGINHTDSGVLNPHLQALAAECKTFVLEQPIISPTGYDVEAAMQRFLERGLGSGDFAGSALSPSRVLSA
jgi:hypothetical protein